MAPVRRADRARGFAIEVEGIGELGCGDVRGFREASLAAADPRAVAPQRLVIVAPEPDLVSWLAEWAEDADQVRRTITVSRRFDARSVDAIATICSFGAGIETSLAVESVSARRAGRHREILRSGVYLKVDVDAVLACHDAEADAESAALELGLLDFD